MSGLGITAVIQSSSATTVMVVGFVNSGLMTLGQAVNVIMGANIGTTVTAWFLSLAGIDSAALRSNACPIMFIPNKNRLRPPVNVSRSKISIVGASFHFLYKCIIKSITTLVIHRQCQGF